MAQFSIREALSFSFQTYRQHVVVLLVAGCLVGGSLLLWQEGPSFVAKKLGVYMPLMPHEPLNIPSGTEQSEMAINRIHDVTQRLSMHLQSAPKHLLLLVLLVAILLLCLHVFCTMALIRVCLSLATTKKASINDLFKSERIGTAIGAFALFTLYFMCVVLGASLLTVPVILVLKAVAGIRTAAVVGMLSWAIFFVGVAFWTVGYLFFPFVVVDNLKAGARKALSISQTITTGLRLPLVGAVIVASILFGLITSGIFILLGMIGMQGMMNLRLACAAAVTSPFWFLYLGSIYTVIKGK